LRIVVSGNVGWFAIPFIVLAGLGYMWIVSGLLKPSSGDARRNKPAALPSLGFTDLYALFGRGPFLGEEWPVLQSAANDEEDRTLSRLNASDRTAR
jgi:hypothetical protein